MRYLKSLVYIVLPILFPISAHAQVNAEQVTNIGRNVLSLEEYMLSIHYFNLAINAKPYMADPYYFRGLAKLMLDDYRGAEADCTEAIEKNKFLTEAYRVRGFARAKMGKDSLALLDFNKGLEYIPVDKYFLFYKGSTQTALEKYDDAEKTFRTLLRYFPSFDSAYSELARLNLQKGDTATAISNLDTAINLNKKEPYPYLMRADIEARNKKWQEARQDLDYAIELMPKETSLYLNRAYIRYNDDDYFGAMSDYNYALELEPENLAARYNRGLLRYEVRDLPGSLQDFTEVLQHEPDNFHARYSRALINLELDKNKEARSDLQKIAEKYPRFYPVYYALAQTEQNMGNLQKAIGYYNKAESLIKGYVTNPSKNTLDKPTITSGTSNTEGHERHDEEETDMEVMERFNKLVTVSSTETAPKYSYKQEGIKGKIQDRDMKVSLEPMYAISLYDNTSELRNSRNYFRELSDINNAGYSRFNLFVTNEPSVPSDSSEIERLFDLCNSLSSDMEKSDYKERPVDYLSRGILLFLLKDYEHASVDFDKAIALKNDMTTALFARAYLKVAKAKMNGVQAGDEPGNKDVKNLPIDAMERRSNYLSALKDLEEAVKIAPQLIYGWYNRGYLLYEMEDYTSALECFTKAIEIDKDFGEAYFNRGLTYMRLGNKAAGRADLSKAGELGVLPSYNVLKRMQ